METQLLSRTNTEEQMMGTEDPIKVQVIQVSESTLRQIIQESVHETLSLLGMEIDDPREMQKDFGYLREWRETVASIKKKGILTLVGISVAGVLGLIWLGIKVKFLEMKGH